MAVFIDHKQRVENYFVAWKNYDTELLRTIFSHSAKYIIRRKIVYNGIDEIIRYWEKNKKRQKDIQLHWKIVNSSFQFEIVQFGAYFWDLESKMYTKVNGQIIFKYNHDNQIICLTEAYKKRTEKNKSDQIGVRCYR
ncbi:hypothetical protein [Catenibacterium sp.]|uniref:hypothetical protein n=1 Tax=Catenibacterium sp. TaxID=2049022 RepID=UPI003994D086